MLVDDIKDSNSFIVKFIIIMFQILVVLIVSITLVCVGTNQLIDSNTPLESRSFAIYDNGNTFLKDGKPFRFIAGSFHYFRAHQETWQRKLRTMRAAGLNAVTTYVEWSLHNPKEGVYTWEGIADLERFINLAEQEDLLVILRPGPYICAERDLGGFPYWLLRKYPGIQLRTSDINYKKEVEQWFSLLMQKIIPRLYGNGGPIIMVQVENEYGSFFACDHKYSEWLRDLMLNFVKDKAVLFTNDGPGQLPCGFIPGVLPTLDFGGSTNTTWAWNKLRARRPKGPLVNAEFYPGWLTHWQSGMSRSKLESFAPTFIRMLDEGANVNFYMFYGGTNFGFTAGANQDGPETYTADVTSYDYDAPMDESGDPTPKYMALREIIGRYLPLPNISVPEPTYKEHYGKMKLSPSGCILSHDGRKHLSEGRIHSKKPLSFEALDQYSGLVLYETILPPVKRDPAVLTIAKGYDRSYVYVDRQLIGVMSRENMVYKLPILSQSGTKLQILVENQGRINFQLPNDFKGILSDVILEKTVLKNWNITKYPMENYTNIENFIENSIPAKGRHHKFHEMLRSGPIVFHGNLFINNTTPYDTYMDPTGWGKGVLFINGYNLGRYWPVVGPQITLYVPKEILNNGDNRVVMIEYQMAPESGEILFTNIPNLDGNH